MQEKVEEILNRCIDWDKDCPGPCFHVGHITAEILKLIKGEVMWETEGQVRQYIHKTAVEMPHTGVPLYLKTKLNHRDGHHVRVTVSDEEETCQEKQTLQTSSQSGS